MRKTNFFVKYLKYISNFINSLLEKNLNKLNFKNLSKIFKNNKIILIFVAVFVVFISYLLLPTFYKQSEISKKLSTELRNKFEVNFKFSQNLKYNFFPKPHFTATDLIIFDDNGEISKIKNLKIFVSTDKLLSIKKVQIKNLIIQNGNFTINKKNYNFFHQLLSKNFKDGNLLIKNSNIFFRNSEGEVLFIKKVLNMKYYYEPKELKNILFASNEIFNVPYTIETFLNNDESKILSKININLIKLTVENELNLNNEKKIGKSVLDFKKSKQIVEYEIEKKYFKFHVYDKINQPSITFKGEFNLKPFYANLDSDLAEVNLNYLFGSNAIIAQLLKTEIFNNKNIDFKLNMKAEKIFNNSNFRNINLKSKIQDGLIDTDKTKFSWKDFADFELEESLIYVRDGELVLDGKLKINISDYNKIYKFLLTPKNYRKKIKKVDLNFTYNFDQKIAELKDIKIDEKINNNINKILNNVTLKKDDFQNKIYFKNLLNKAIKSYAG